MFGVSKIILYNHLTEEVARLLDMDSSENVDIQRPLADVGLDSVVAIELKSTLEIALGIKLAPTVAIEYPTIQKLADYLLPKIPVSNSNIS